MGPNEKPPAETPVEIVKIAETMSPSSRQTGEGRRVAVPNFNFLISSAR
jgi:hypothetical protein